MPTITGVDLTGGQTLEPSATTTLTVPLSDDLIRDSVRDILARSNREYALEMVTMLQVQERIAGDTGERLSFAEFASQVGLDLEQLRAE